MYVDKLSYCRADTDWRTKVHARGTCASYGICGHRKDGDVLNCANNTVAQPIGSSVAQKLQVPPSTAAPKWQTAWSSCMSMCHQSWQLGATLAHNLGSCVVTSVK